MLFCLLFLLLQLLFCLHACLCHTVCVFVSHFIFWLKFAAVIMSVALSIPDSENEPTAILDDLQHECMSLPLSDSPHRMHLRTPLRVLPPLDIAHLGSPMTSEAGSPLARSPVPKRLRLRQKTRPPPEASAPHWPLQGVAEDFVSRRVWNGMNDKLRYNYAYDKIRNNFVWRIYAERLADEESRVAYNNLPNRDKQAEARVAFKSLEREERNEMARRWLEVSSPPAWVKLFVEHRFLAGDGIGDGRCGGRSRCTGQMMTWILPVDPPSATSEIAQSLPPEQLPLAELVLRLRDDSVARALFRRVEDHGMKMQMLVGADDVAMCLEVCPETWTEQKILRLHIHMFFKSAASYLRVKKCASFDFEGCPAMLSADFTANGSKNRASWSGFFYCCLLDKKGTVFSLATKAPFTKFLVSPSWIMSLVQSGKLDTRVARELLVKCVSASRWVKELEQYELELEKDAVKEAMEEAQILLTRQMKKQKFYDKVADWLSQFEVAQHRYKFLVLSGPSRVGKTAFARSLCDPGKETLEVNCASGMEPNLRAYRLRLHGLILFDEIVADQVAQQRKFFQAQSAPVQLGCSATNCHSYDVFVWRTKLVLASNNWHSSLAKLKPEDQDWINVNSIVLDVEEEMWEM